MNATTLVPSLDRELKICLEAVSHASKCTQLARTSLAKHIKPDKTPLTAADLASQTIILHHLLKAFPNDPVLAEEDLKSIPEELKAQVTELLSNVAPGLETFNQLPPRAPCEADTRFWTIDPIDGTKGFLREGGQYSICIALVVKHGDFCWKPVLGVIGCPVLEGQGVIYFCTEGDSLNCTHKIDIELKQRPVRLVKEAFHLFPVKLENLVFTRGVESGHSDVSLVDKVKELLNISTAYVLADSQVKSCLIADPQYTTHAMLKRELPLYREKIWDIAPGWVIARGAGAHITTLDGKTELPFGPKADMDWIDGIFVTSSNVNQNTRAKIIETIHQIINK